MDLIDTRDSLAGLGQRLRECRIARGDTQALFADRIGCSSVTVRAMERGDPAVGIGWWTKAFWLLDRLPELDGLLRQSSLFEDFTGRKRQRRKRGSP